MKIHSFRRPATRDCHPKPRSTLMLFFRPLIVVALGAVSLAQTAPQNSGPGQQTAASGQTQTATPTTPATPQTKSGADARQNSPNPEAERERSGADPLLDLPALPN